MVLIVINVFLVDIYHKHVLPYGLKDVLLIYPKSNHMLIKSPCLLRLSFLSESSLFMTSLVSNLLFENEYENKSEEVWIRLRMMVDWMHSSTPCVLGWTKHLFIGEVCQRHVFWKLQRDDQLCDIFFYNTKKSNRQRVRKNTNWIESLPRLIALFNCEISIVIQRERNQLRKSSNLWKIQSDKKISDFIKE